MTPPLLCTGSQPSASEPTLTLAERRRSMLALFGGVAFAATGYLPAVGVAPLAAEDMLGSPRWSGLPGAVTIAGMALGAGALAHVMSLRGRRFGLLLGLALAAVAALAAGLAAAVGSFPLFLLALLLLGGGFAARQLSRYAAGDLYGEEFRARAIGRIVWAGTVGSVLGPLLLEPSQATAIAFGVPGLVGPYALCSAMLALAWVLLFSTLADRRPPPASDATGSGAPRELPAQRSPLRQPRARFALLSLVVGQFVMVLIMAMTPVHIRHGGGDLGIVGLVLSAHTLGMFALSPLTGTLADRYGPMRIILAGQALLLVSTLLAAPAAGHHHWTLVIALFLLGLGWNFGFVAGSSLLTDALPPGDRIRLQGMVDVVVWLAAAAANLASGVLLEGRGYPALNLTGAVLVLLPPLVAWRHRSVLRNALSADAG